MDGSDTLSCLNILSSFISRLNPAVKLEIRGQYDLVASLFDRPGQFPRLVNLDLVTKVVLANTKSGDAVIRLISEHAGSLERLSFAMPYGSWRMGASEEQMM
jgi:hypothetical protein